MNAFLDIYNLILTNPIINLLVIFYKLFSLVGIPYAFGFSIIALTVFTRLLLLPFTSAQLKSAAKMQRVAPHLSAIRKKHKDDQKRQQAEIMKLYKEHGVNPAAGCLPVLIQLPITLALYHVLNTTVKVSAAKDLVDINGVLYFDWLKLQRVWDTTFFGLPLGITPWDLMQKMPLIALVPILTGVFQFILSKMMMPDDSLLPSVGKDEKKEDDFQSAFQKQSMFLFPAMIGFFSFTLPLGLSLYWNAFTIFGIIQQYIQIGPGAAKPWFDKLKKNGNS